jgi:transposase InsO family protein
MAHYNYPRGAIHEIHDAPYMFVPGTIPGRVHLMHCHTGEPYRITGPTGELELPTPDDYDDLLINGHLIVKEPESAILARKIASDADWDMADCEALDPKARKMLVQCQILDDHGIKNGVKAIALGLTDHWTPELRDKFGEHDNPHTIKRWRSERGDIGNRNGRDMVRMWGKVPRAPYLDDVVEEVKQKAALRHHVYEGSYADAHSEVSDELQAINDRRSEQYAKPEKPYKIPSYDTVRRTCIALECAATADTRDGKQGVQAGWRGAGKSLTARRALELCIIDHTPLSGYFVVDPEREMVAGQPWLSVMIDVHSEVILAHVISYLAPSVWTVGELLKRASLPKRPPPCFIERYPILRRVCGKPAEVIVDNAAEFRSQALEDAAKAAGFAIRHCPIKKPTYRAIGERIFPTLQTKITKLIPGGTKPIALARKLGHDPEKEACVTVGELEALSNYAIAEYHTDTHEGLQGRQPALVFEKSANKHGIDLIHDLKGFQREILDVELGVQLSKSGIRRFGLRYHCARAVPKLLDDLVAVEPRRQRRDEATATVKVKFDQNDISVVHVWNRVTKKYVTLRCADETYADGMPLWFHEQIQQAARDEAADFNTEEEPLAARAKRIKAIRNISPEAKLRERKLVAKLFEIPRLRRITGNLVHLHTDEPEPVTLDEFISHDLAATTMLDDEILAPRLPIAGPQKPKERRDRRGAGQPRKSEQAPASSHRPRTRRVSGSYN